MRMNLFVVLVCFCCLSAVQVLCELTLPLPQATSFRSWRRLQAGAVIAPTLPQTEEDRKAWCAAIRQKHHMTDSGNTLAVLPKTQRDSYLRLCVTTPGSIQHSALQENMHVKEKDLAEVLGHPIQDVQRFCEETKERYHVIPGQDFGTMPSHIHPLYLRARCYRFFCEPHERAGLGKFDCVPLKKPYEGD